MTLRMNPVAFLINNMMTHYLEYILDHDEGGAFLLAMIMKGIHSFIVFEEGENAKQQSKIAIAPISTPHSTATQPAGVRIFGDEKVLAKLLRYPVLLRYLNDRPTKIKPVPEPIEWASWYRDRTLDRNTPSRLRRHEARGYKQPPAPSQTNQFFDVPIRSDKTGQQFALRMVCDSANKVNAPVFNTYGLAVRGFGVTPVF